MIQTDTAGDAGPKVGCAAGTPTSFPVAKECDDNGTAGTSSFTLSVDASAANLRGVMFQSINNEPGKVIWDAGNWAVRMNVTTGNMNVTWDEVHICRFDNAGNNLATVGSATGLGIALGTTGVKSATVSGAVQTANLTDEIYVILSFDNAGKAAAIFSITPNQTIDTPISVSIPNQLMMMGHGV